MTMRMTAGRSGRCRAASTPYSIGGAAVTDYDARFTSGPPELSDQQIGRLSTSILQRVRVRRGRRRLAAVSSVTLLAVAGLLVAATRAADDDQVKVTTIPAHRTTGMKTYRDPVLGWTFLQPNGWTAQSYERMCRIRESGSLISNHPRPVPHATIGDGCTTACATKAQTSPGFVAVQILHFTGGPRPPIPLGSDTAGR